MKRIRSLGKLIMLMKIDLGDGIGYRINTIIGIERNFIIFIEELSDKTYNSSVFCMNILESIIKASRLLVE